MMSTLKVRHDYQKRWHAHPISSSSFQDGYHHQNPTPRLPPGAVETVAADATLAGSGGLGVPPDLLSQLEHWQNVAIPNLRPRDGAAIAREKTYSSMGLTPESFRELLASAHEIMREEAEAERL